MLKKTLFITLIALLTTACKDDKGTPAPSVLALGTDTITALCDGGNEPLSVTAPSAWSASADQPWLTLTPANGYGSQECVVSIDSTLITDVRTAHIRFVGDGMQECRLTVVQTGYGNIIHTDSTDVHVVASQRNRSDRHFSLALTTNVAFDVTIEYPEGVREWLTPKTTEIRLDRGARPRTASLRFDWTNNAQSEQRVAKIKFTPKDPTQTLRQPAVVTVTQGAAPRIEDNRAGDSLAVVLLAQTLDQYSEWDMNENMSHWSFVRLWEKNDKTLPCPEAVGRLRDAQFFLCDYQDDELPPQVGCLKYAESLSFYSNVNSFLRDLHLGADICNLKHLRSLEVFAWGLVDLPAELVNLAPTLERLSIGGNNFNSLPAVLTKENFPKLRILEMQACRRWTVSDLRNANDTKYEGGIGLHINTASSDDLRRLLLWDTLEQLVLSYNFIEGSVPDFKVGEDGVEAWTQRDVDEWGGDTISFLVGRPKVLPRCKWLTLNLNYFTGNAPEWLLYHPSLLDWNPETLIFNQQEYGLDSQGRSVRFDNTPTNFEYYYNAFPLYRSKYEIKEEKED